MKNDYNPLDFGGMPYFQTNPHPNHVPRNSRDLGAASSLHHVFLGVSHVHQVTSAGMSHLLGVTAHNFHHLSLLIILCGACATLPLPLAQFIPENATWAHRLATESEESLAAASEQLPVPAGLSSLGMERMEDQEEFMEVRLPAACRESDAEGGQRCTGQREARVNMPMLGEAAMPAG